jgi:hypothetical protein
MPLIYREIASQASLCRRGSLSGRRKTRVKPNRHNCGEAAIQIKEKPIDHHRPGAGETLDYPRPAERGQAKKPKIVCPLLRLAEMISR